MSSSSPDAVFAALHRAAQHAYGAKLFTVTVLDPVAGLARRAYSSHPHDYPTSGTKPIQDNAWTAQVIGSGERFVANSTAEFAPFFGDHALINSLGCEAAMNIPVPDEAGRVVGTVNILDVAHHFTRDCAAGLQALVATHRADLLAAMAAVPMESPT